MLNPEFCCTKLLVAVIGPAGGAWLGMAAADTLLILLLLLCLTLLLGAGGDV